MKKHSFGKYLTLVAFIVAMALANSAPAYGDNPSTGTKGGQGNQDRTGQTKADLIKTYTEEMQFWDLLFNRCVYKFEQTYHDEINACNKSTWMTEKQKKECKEKALDAFFAGHKQCTVFRDEADKWRDKIKELNKKK
ncbi:hypothetical protein HZA40_01010 [Candidatus Peregrinibacteria bacterium]|nr:hypothetical protein [Candidatus Peregrinibacteria bacterium]